MRRICTKSTGFRPAAGSEERSSNYDVEADTMLLSSRAVAHMVDGATHFCAASFLQNQYSPEIWRFLRQVWSLVYLGPSGFLIADQRSAYTPRKMKETVKASRVHLEEAPVKIPGTNSAVKTYHGPLRLAYEHIRADTEHHTQGKECLRLAVFVASYTVRLEGLCAVILVFGAFPRSGWTNPASTPLERAKLFDEVMEKVAKRQSRGKIVFGFRQSNWPGDLEYS